MGPKREYAVWESGAVYYTEEIYRMMEWFERVLGWYARADCWDDAGKPVHAVVSPAPAETAALTLTPFTGIHLIAGETQPRSPALVRVDNISKLSEHIMQAGWMKRTEPEEMSWGGLQCEAETPDGGRLIFFQFD